MYCVVVVVVCNDLVGIECIVVEWCVDVDVYIIW